MKSSRSRCPHDDVRWCPLFLAMHIAGGPSCDAGKLAEGTCAVSRGASYAQLLGCLMAKHPRLVPELDWERTAAESRAQRDRNRRLNGVH